MPDNERSSTQKRETSETSINAYLSIDGSGTFDVDTGNGMLDHLIAQLSRHGLIDIELKARGDV